MDSGLCPGNYFNYTDDEVAIQREFELADGFDLFYNDDSFPANSRYYSH